MNKLEWSLVNTPVEDSELDKRVVLFARIPFGGGFVAAKNQFVEPLEAWARTKDNSWIIKHYDLPAPEFKPAGLGIEVKGLEFRSCPELISKLAELGAPDETVVEVETDKAMTTTTIGEAMGR